MQRTPVEIRQGCVFSIKAGSKMRVPGRPFYTGGLVGDTLSLPPLGEVAPQSRSGSAPQLSAMPRKPPTAACGRHLPQRGRPRKGTGLPHRGRPLLAMTVEGGLGWGPQITPKTNTSSIIQSQYYHPLSKSTLFPHFRCIWGGGLVL